ncbi:hypothetical protein [Moraxella oculi]|uniref:Uncharacterized protein n=1 Tax=Moraxella oculi TaxID=2940516 RepID=A0ABW8U3J5_9GAMM
MVIPYKQIIGILRITHTVDFNGILSGTAPYFVAEHSTSVYVDKNTFVMSISITFPFIRNARTVFFMPSFSIALSSLSTTYHKR